MTRIKTFYNEVYYTFPQTPTNTLPTEEFLEGDYDNFPVLNNMIIHISFKKNRFQILEKENKSNYDYNLNEIIKRFQKIEIDQSVNKRFKYLEV